MYSIRSVRPTSWGGDGSTHIHCQPWQFTQTAKPNQGRIGSSHDCFLIPLSFCYTDQILGTMAFLLNDRCYTLCYLMIQCKYFVLEYELTISTIYCTCGSTWKKDIRWLWTCRMWFSRVAHDNQFNYYFNKHHVPFLVWHQAKAVVLILLLTKMKDTM